MCAQNGRHLDHRVEAGGVQQSGLQLLQALSGTLANTSGKRRANSIAIRAHIADRLW